MEQHVCVGKFFQRCLEGLNEVVGQLADKADGVGKQNLLQLVHLQSAGGGVQSVEKAVVGGDVCAGEAVEKGAFARVGVAHKGNNGHFVFLSAAALNASYLADLLQFLLKLCDLAADMAAVAFELGLAGTAGAYCAFLTLKVGPHTQKTG